MSPTLAGSAGALWYMTPIDEHRHCCFCKGKFLSVPTFPPSSSSPQLQETLGVVLSTFDDLMQYCFTSCHLPTFTNQDMAMPAARILRKHGADVAGTATRPGCSTHRDYSDYGAGNGYSYTEFTEAYFECRSFLEKGDLRLSRPHGSIIVRPCGSQSRRDDLCQVMVPWTVAETSIQTKSSWKNRLVE